MRRSLRIREPQNALIDVGIAGVGIGPLQFENAAAAVQDKVLRPGDVAIHREASRRHREERVCPAGQLQVAGPGDGVSAGHIDQVVREDSAAEAERLVERNCRRTGIRELQLVQHEARDVHEGRAVVDRHDDDRTAGFAGRRDAGNAPVPGIAPVVREAAVVPNVGGGDDAVFEAFEIR